MTQAIARTTTFNEFINFEDGNELNEYELVAGRLVLMSEPSDWHEEILECPRDKKGRVLAYL